MYEVHAQNAPWIPPFGIWHLLIEHCRYTDAVFPKPWRAQMPPNGAEPFECSPQASQRQTCQLCSFRAQFKLDSDARWEVLAGYLVGAFTEGLLPTTLIGDNGLPIWFRSSNVDFLDRRGGVTIMVMRLPVEKAGPPSSAAASWRFWMSDVRSAIVIVGGCIQGNFIRGCSVFCAYWDNDTWYFTVFETGGRYLCDIHCPRETPALAHLITSTTYILS